MPRPLSAGQRRAQRADRMKPTTTIRLLPNGDTLTFTRLASAISDKKAVKMALQEIRGTKTPPGR